MLNCLFLRVFLLSIGIACTITSCKRSEEKNYALNMADGADGHATNQNQLHSQRLIDSLISNAAEIRYAYPDSSLKILDTALQRSIGSKFEQGIAASLMIKGLTYFEKGDYIEATEHVDKAKAYIKAPVQMAQWHLNTAVVLSRIEGHQQQLRHYFDALDILEQSKDTSNLIYAIILSNISRVWGQVEEFEKRDYYYQKAIGLAENYATHSLAWQDLLVHLYNSRASYLLDENKLEEARLLLEKSLAITDNYQMLNRRKSEALLLLSSVYAEYGSIEKAYEVMDRYAAVNADKDVYTSIIVPNMVKSTIAKREQNPHRTIEFVNIAFKHARATGLDKSPKIITLLENKIDAQAKLGLYDEALSGYADLIALLNANYNIEKANTNRTLDFMYRTTLKDKELSNNQLLIARKNHQIYQQKIIIGFFAAVVVVALLLVYSYKKRQQSQQRLYELQRKSDEIKHLRSITAIEEVQKRKLGAELHDGINGSMAAIKMNLGTIRKTYPDLSQSPVFLETEQMLKETTEEIRQTAHALIPEILLKNGLNQALIAHINRINSASTLNIDYNFFMEENGLNPLANLTLYRIVQELLQNIVKHAQASKVIVQILATREKVSLIVEDNGIGFDTEKSYSGIGLNNVSVRVQSLEGELDIQSTINKQTVVRVTFEKQKLI